MTSTYFSNGDSSTLNIKVDYITNTRMVIHILEDGDDYGYVIDLDPSNELFYRYDTQLNKFIELNTFNDWCTYLGYPHLRKKIKHELVNGIEHSWW
jgi:hypothetical protein